MPTPKRRSTALLRRALLTWYDAHGRDLPWRREPSAYRTLVSEFMLQQTQVATVLPYFDRFLERFPTLQTLADAPEEAVRVAWSGLGYYRRARNLQAVARVLCERGGDLPADLEALRELPGVGDYTAAALGSIIHELPRGVVDGNVIRVLCRLEAIGDDPRKAGVKRHLQELADQLLDPRRAGDWNQAVMELGARVCTPRAPQCPRCPLRRDCSGYAEGDPERYPSRPPRVQTVSVTLAVAVLRRRGAFLLELRRDPRLLDGMWEFPSLEVAQGADPRGAVIELVEDRFPGRHRVGAELARVKHSITTRRITVRGFAVAIDPTPRARKGTRMWVTVEGARELPMSSMTTKLLRELSRLEGRHG